jgi:Uma2 family endonuclease
MSTLAKHLITPEEYLELDSKAEYRSEYHDGEMFPMEAASPCHSLIGTQLVMLVGVHLREKTCMVFGSDMRILVAPSGLYTYPDLSVVCGKPQLADANTLANPMLLVEILSPSTQDYDRGTKSKLYRSIPSLQDLLFIAQNDYDVELYRRQGDATWSLIGANGLDASIELTSIQYTLPLRELYEKVAAYRENAG